MVGHEPGLAPRPRPRPGPGARPVLRPHRPLQIVDPYASKDDIFVFHTTAGFSYTVQSGSYHDPFLLRLYDDAGNAIAADDGSGANGYDYAAFTAPYTG